MSQNLEIETLDHKKDTNPVFSGLVEALGTTRSTLNTRKGLNPNLDGLAGSHFHLHLDKLFRMHITGQIVLSFWSGEHPDSYGIGIATPHRHVFQTDRDVDLGTERDVFEGALLEVFAYVEKNEAKQNGYSSINAMSALFRETGRLAVETFGEDIAVMERVSPPTGHASTPNGRISNRFFKKTQTTDALEQVSQAVASAGFSRTEGAHYHFRDDCQPKPMYSLVSRLP